MHFLLMLTLKLQTKSQILGILLAQENEYLIEKRDIHHPLLLKCFIALL